MKRIVAVMTVLGLLGAGGAAVLQLGHWLVSADPRQPVDVVVALGGDPDRRLPVAIDDLESGLADRVWVAVEQPGQVLREPERIVDYARSRGVADAVEVLGASTSTRDDAALVARRLGELGDRPTVALVTAPWHATRARITFERTLQDRADIVVWPDARPYDPSRWWRSDADTTTVEALKLVGTLALYGARPSSPFAPVPADLPLRAAAGGLLGAVLAGAVVRPLARRLGMVARPRLFRAHVVPVPLLGGLALLAGLGTGVLAAGGFSIGPAGLVAVGGIVSLALVGLADDLVGLGARSRLAWAAAAGTAAWLLGLRAVVLSGGGAGSDAVNAAATILWFVGITHALNLLDNLDGAAAGVGAVSAATIAVVAVTGGQWMVAVGAAALAGACVGYLVHNVHPARLFMGDLGALALGFALAALAMALRPTQEPPVSFAVAILVLGVPIFDTVLVTVSRLRARRPVNLGGTDHTAHRLIARGWTVRRASAALWGAQAVLGIAALAVAGLPRAVAWSAVGVVLVLGVLALGWFLRASEWAAPGREEEHRGVLDALEGTLEPLRSFVIAARSNGLAGSDRDTVVGAEETLQRLERTRGMLRRD